MSIQGAAIVVGRIGLVLAGLLVATLIAEGAARLIDHQPLFSRLGDPLANAPQRSLALDADVGGGSLPPDVRAEWLANPPPPPPPQPADETLLARRAQAMRNGLVALEFFRVWNAGFVRRHGCEPGSPIRRLPQPIPIFDPVRPGVEMPPYRYLADRSLPGGLFTNRFGFRGPDVPIDKPPATIRLAFVGASTTVGHWRLPWSYPELVLHWLNVWARENHLPFHFDGVNAGREGMASAAITAITAQEVLPLEPDLVVYYEGANQSLCTVQVPGRTPRPAPTGPLARVDAFAARWRDVSQLARRLQGAIVRAQMRGGLEPDKPALPPNSWRDAYGGLAQLGRTNLPPGERQILADLDVLRRRVALSGAWLVLTSFEWLVADGLRLDPQRDAAIFRHLNEWCWPYRYADLRRAVDLHNGWSPPSPPATRSPSSTSRPSFPTIRVCSGIPSTSTPTVPACTPGSPSAACCR